MIRLFRPMIHPAWRVSSSRFYAKPLYRSHRSSEGWWRSMWALQSGAMDQQQFIDFVRQRGLAVIATRGTDGGPQAALVGITATERGELVFDTSRRSRKYRNLSAFAQVAVVIGWDNEMTVQCEGTADIPMGADHDRCLQAYLSQYPDGVERAHDHDIVHVRVRPNWLRYSDYRPGSFAVEETTLVN
jgi:general stress protein 26